MTKKTYRPAKFPRFLALIFFALPTLLLGNAAYADHRSGCIPEYVSYHFTPRTVDVNGEEKFIYKNVVVELAHMPLPEELKTGCWPPSQLPRPNPLTTAKVTVNDLVIEIPAACFTRSVWPVTSVKITPYYQLLYVTIHTTALEDQTKQREIVLTLDPTKGGSKSFKDWDLPPASCDIDSDLVWP